MPRGFGKTRFELTVTESFRERFAAITGADPNIEVTKKAAEVLENLANGGSFFSQQAFEDFWKIIRFKNYLLESYESFAEKRDQDLNRCDRLLKLCNKWEKICNWWINEYN